MGMPWLGWLPMQPRPAPKVTICDYPETSMLPRLAAFVHGVYAQRHGHLVRVKGWPSDSWGTGEPSHHNFLPFLLGVNIYQLPPSSRPAARSLGPRLCLPPSSPFTACRWSPGCLGKGGGDARGIAGCWGGFRICCKIRALWDLSTNQAGVIWKLHHRICIYIWLWINTY